MNVSADLIKQVNEKVQQTVQKIEQIYGTKFHKAVDVRYDINSARLGGQALIGSFEIRLNPAYLNKYKEEYINRTVVHEVVHLGIEQVYRKDQGHWKVDAHGPEWKNMMVRLGADPSRCHSYEPDEGQGRPKTKYAYVCARCNKPIPVGPKVHSKLQKGANYRTTCCQAILIHKGTIGAVPNEIARQKIAANDLQPTNAITQPTLKKPDPNSKLGKCYILYRTYITNNPNRKQWITMFMNLANCTEAGASTYLSTCVKLYAQKV